MGKLEEKSDGNYVLEVKVGCLSINKAFKDAEKPLDEISQTPMSNGFYLYIPDVKSDSNDDKQTDKQ